MKVILKQDHEKLGAAGEVVNVKDGFGRNYLIPRGIAVLATPSRIKQYEEEVRQAARKRVQAREAAVAQQRELEKIEIPIMVKVGEENRIFGTVTTQQIAVELAKRGFEIDRRDISIDEDIRLVGVYTASVRVYEDVTASVKINVMPEA